MCVRVEEVAAHQLLRDRLEVVVEHDDVIAVPADAAADVQQDLGKDTSSTALILSVIVSVGW